MNMHLPIPHLRRPLLRLAPAWLAALLLALVSLWPLPGHAALEPRTLAALAAASNDERLAAIGQLGRSSDPQAIVVLQALHEGRLYADPAAGQLWLQSGAGDAVTTADGTAATLPETATRITINNRLRRALASALATAQLHATDTATRLQAARQLRHSQDADLLPQLNVALATEPDPAVKKALQIAVASLELQSPDASTRLHAVNLLAHAQEASFRAPLAAMLEKNAEGQFHEPDLAVRTAAAQAVQKLDAHLKKIEWAGNLFYGLSLGSVLLLAALGLAITFGLMGVINMAHGEFLMIGAYATWLVQLAFRQWAPQWLDWYVLAALPVAFCLTACVGMVLERTVIRWLYGRPLETLLATWGISLVLMQAVRSLFGAQNVEVANPGWLSGGVEVMNGLVLSYNRLAIIVFSLLVVLFVWLLLNHTRLGLFVRSITQNRRMADCVGVPTGRIDMLTFGLGAGIAGLGGVALSQLGNVGPDLGRAYIIDSFMVVVLGGVGQLAGTVIAAFALGSISKFMEPFAGAVLAKIAVLVLIVLFIQKRPQGLFAPKGRSVE
ncbi:urea transport system permease protein [Lampropedia hyalina DSM 16112]|jgi:urea transport system permease protein|uniref:Urea transport system permease protein n=2 Tax=Lampropedia TaxID=198705 RepID=A0A1M4WDZ6_9BURK|nr:urea transport system permease protein [Lampropedia hyalina DSM 16112]